MDGTCRTPEGIDRTLAAVLQDSARSHTMAWRPVRDAELIGLQMYVHIFVGIILHTSARWPGAHQPGDQSDVQAGSKSTTNHG